MKKITVILLSAVLILTACLLCSCDIPIQAADSETLRGPAAEPAEDIAEVIGGREIVEVYIPSAAVTSSIRPLYDYGGGVIRSEKLNGEEPAKTYPVTVEFHGDLVTVNYYVATESGAAQRSVLTGKDNVIIYLK